MPNPVDVARLSHRFQVRLENTVTARTLVVSRIQRFEPQTRQQTEVYYELGSVDPTGEASESPEFTIQIEEYVHDVQLDLLLAGKAVTAGQTWNLTDYIHDGNLVAYLLERSNLGVIKGELQFSRAVLTEIAYRWQMGQPIMATYTLNAQLGKHWAPGYAPHPTWGVQDTTTPGGIRVKDSRVFMGGDGAAYRMYRLQGFNIRAQFPSTPVREIGSRALVGYVVEQPRTTVDMDFLAADEQPDQIFYANEPSAGAVQYYDFVNPQLLAASYVRIYDPEDAEAATVIRSFKIENLKPSNSTPISASVRGIATKRYSFVLSKAATPGTGGLIFKDGDF